MTAHATLSLAVFLLLGSGIALACAMRASHAAAGSIVLLALTSLGLARVACFDPLWAAMLTAGLGCGLAVVCARRKTQALALDTPLARSWRWAAACVIGASGLLYAAFPTYYLLGGLDPGIYLLTAVRIADTGAVDFSFPGLDPLATEILPLSSQTAEPLVGFDLAAGHAFAGIYYENARSPFAPPRTKDPRAEVALSHGQRLQPQFTHLYPALGAWAFALGGLEALVRVNAVIALIALWIAWRLLLRLFAPPFALAGIALLGGCPGVLYWARMSVSEPLALLLGLFGMELWLSARERKQAMVAFTAGAVWGVACLARIDAVLWCTAALAAQLETTASNEQRLARMLGLGVLSGLALSLGDQVVSSWLYVSGQRQVLLAGLAVAVAALGLPLLPPAFAAALTRRAGVVLAWTMVGWSTWLLVVRWWFSPWLWPGTHEATRAFAGWELSWYTTPLALPLASIGAWHLARQRQGLPWSTAAVLATVIFTHDPQIYAGHPWASRRWVPQVIPTLLVLAMLGWQQCALWRPAASKWLSMVVWCIAWVWCIAFCAPFLFVAQLQGLAAPLEALRREALTSLGPDGYVTPRVRAFDLTVEDQLAPVLTYYCRRPTLPLTNAGRRILAARPSDNPSDVGSPAAQRFSALDGWRLVGLDPFHHALGTASEPLAIFARVLDRERRRWPRRIFEDSWCLDRGLIQARDELLAVEVSAAHPSLHTRVGKRRGTSLVASEGGSLLGGPYLFLRPARYRASWSGALEALTSQRSELAECYLAVSNSGTPHPALPRIQLQRGIKGLGWYRQGQLLAAVHGDAPFTFEFEFTLITEAAGVELVTQVKDGVTLRLDRIGLRELSNH
jgi:hypothetical protein